MNSGNIHVLWVNLWAVFMYCCISIMPNWNFEYTKTVFIHCCKVGGGMGQGPATEMTHLMLN